MHNTIDEAMCFIHGRDKARGSGWSGSTDGIADAMVDYANLKIGQVLEEGFSKSPWCKHGIFVDKKCVLCEEAKRVDGGNGIPPFDYAGD